MSLDEPSPLDNRTCSVEDSFLRLLSLMRYLRSGNGCPWDRAQDHCSLKPLMVEECAELLDAVDNEDQENLKEELGDLLLHIVFHAQIAEEAGGFGMKDIIDGLNGKLVRRHEHVFGDKTAENPEEGVEVWNASKKKEGKKKGGGSCFEGIPRNLPSLLRAEKVQLRAAEKGFDWSSPGQVLEKIREETEELSAALEKGDREHIAEELGDMFFSVVNLSRFLDAGEAEELLRKAVDKFCGRFGYIEKKLAKSQRARGKAGAAQMERLWEESKRIL